MMGGWCRSSFCSSSNARERSLAMAEDDGYVRGLASGSRGCVIERAREQRLQLTTSRALSRRARRRLVPLLLLHRRRRQLIHPTGLMRPQRRVRPSRLGQQFRVRPDLGHFPPRPQHDDLVALRGRRQAVRDKDAGAPLGQERQGVEDLALGGGVEGRGGLVCLVLGFGGVLGGRVARLREPSAEGRVGGAPLLFHWPKKIKRTKKQDARRLEEGPVVVL